MACVRRFWKSIAAVLCLATHASHGGGGPMNTLVVVNTASRDSRALGAYYAEKRGIPASHLCSIRTDPRASSISLEALENEIRAPILQHVAKEKLDGQIHYLVLCMGIPSRVESLNGITAALFYGYKTPLPDAPQCNVAPRSANQYFGSERAYTSTAGWNRTNAPIPFLLTADSLETAKRVVDRSVAADASFPEGVFCLHGSGDSARNVRPPAYPAVERLFRLFGRGDWIDVDPRAEPLPAVPILGYMTGRAYLPTQFVDMVLAPGAIADHLTSCAGMLPDPCLNQSTVWDWMRLGATASYGTVSEPCAFREKFPDPRLFFWYSRGFTAGEALAMSVLHPYQGIWVGDPLAAPFAAPPSVRIVSPAPHSSLDGAVSLRIAAAAHERGTPPVYVDLYLDGRHWVPVARPFAPVGNDLFALVGTNRFTYAVAPGEDLAGAVAGLAWAINAKGRGAITAKATSDRIEIAVRQPFDEEGQPLPVSVGAEKGFANALYLGGRTGTPELAVEDGVGRAAAAFHLGHAREFELDYPLDLSSIPPGQHILTAVVRDGSAMQCQSQFDLPFRIPEKEP
jgi:uncharacterized protein (TIGR03790 family)